ncbi:MAG: hypothetical protein WAQ24_03650 [Candidatus Saccharimonadales bacterium]
MKTLKHLFISLVVAFVVAAALSLGLHSTRAVQVAKGFVFGPPSAQQTMNAEGVYKTSRWGFPSTYREVETFQSTTGQSFDTSYERKPLNRLWVVTNIVFWMALFVALLAPFTIFWRPSLKPTDQPKPNELNQTKAKDEPQAKQHANTRD